MNIFKTNKFFRVIKHFLLAIPLMVVLGTSLYAIVNPNAKDSYYGETINEISLTLEELKENTRINFNCQRNDDITNINFGVQADNTIYITNLNIVSNNTGVDLSNCNKITFSHSTGLVQYNYYQVNFYNDTDLLVSFYNNANLVIMDFDLLTFVITDNTLLYSKALFTYSYNDYSYVSNAFEYGLYKFTDVGFGKVDFVGIFNGIFTTDINNVYLNFINDYINYYLMVECVYFAPWVLHAFIHFAYSLGDYFMNSFKHNKEDD